MTIGRTITGPTIDPIAGSGPASAAASVRSATAKHDLRLVPAAGVVWAAGLLGLLCGWWAAAATGGCAAAAASAGPWHELRRPGRRSSRSSRGWTRRCAAWTALLVCSAGVVTTTALRIASVAEDPLRASAARGAEAALRITIRERPTLIRSPGYAGRHRGARSVRVPGVVRSASVPGRGVDSAARVTVIAPRAGWAQLVPGQTVTVRGSLAPAGAGEFTGAVLYARGPPRQATPAPWWQQGAAELRDGLHTASSTLADGPAGLLPGLVVGDTSELPPRVDREFEAAGLTHLTAVSGANV